MFPLLMILGFASPVEAPIPVARGFVSLRGLAVDQRGIPFVSAGAKIECIPTFGISQPFVETTGAPAGLAFDRAGDLYVADIGRKAVLKITPWGRIGVVADGYAAEQIAVGLNGEVYFTDSSASRVYRVDSQGHVTQLTSKILAPAGIAVSANGRHVFIADSTGTIWQFSRGLVSRFATLDCKCKTVGLLFDEKGALYVAHGAEVVVISPEGKRIGTYTLPGTAVAGLAFGGVGLNTLYVAESVTGTVYKLQTPHRSQRLPWEPDKPLSITDPPDGAILNRHDGKVTDDGLRIVVQGKTSGSGPVSVNGTKVEVRNGTFQAPVLLRHRESKIAAVARGGRRDTITVLWDRDSFRRYRFSVDDNIRFFKDIAMHGATLKSIFDNEYLAFWREMHRKYQTKVHFNIYYETAGFNLSQMPDKFRNEWQQNADWIRLTFHARAMEPDRPYLAASADQIREDYRLVTREIERFAGKELLSPFTTIHFGATTLAAARALRAEGVLGLVGYFVTPNDLPNVSYYLPLGRIRYLTGRDYWKDMREDLLFIRHDIVVNSVPLEKIVPHLERVAADPHQSEIMELMIHEQFFYPDHNAYVPDYRRRVECAIEWVTRRGYKPVFYGDGFLGAVPLGTRSANPSSF